MIYEIKIKLIEDLGMRFTSESHKYKRRYGLYECGYCGKEFKAQTQNILNGNIKSCGCMRGVNHGLRYHRLYYTWNKMVQRCYNPNATNYNNYGGRGITVCDEWRETPEQFINDMFPSFVEGLTLDRIDNDRGYSKENCRWATASEQSINQRIQKNNTSGFVGVTLSYNKKKFVVDMKVNNKFIRLGTFTTAVEAAIARNKYIIENELPNKLNIIPEEEI